MQKIIIYPLYLYLITLAACAGEPEDIPPGFTQGPVFFAELLVDGQRLEMTAGVDGYALTATHSDVDGVTHYGAYLHREECATACPESLRFRFWGSADSSADNHTSTFAGGPKDYFEEKIHPSVTLEFGVAESIGTTDGAAYWASASGNNPGQIFSVQAGMDEVVEVCYNSAQGILGNDHCLASYCFRMQSDAPCLGWLKAEKVYGNNVLVEPVLMGEGPYSFEWMNGATAPFILLPLTEGTTRGVQVVINGPNDCVIEINQTLRMTGSVPFLCPSTPGFYLNSYLTPFEQFNSVQVEYIDAGGVYYSSAAGPQHQAMFEIHDVEPFVTSPLGFPTLKVSGTLHCTLFATDGQMSIPLTIQEFVIAVSHDE